MATRLSSGGLRQPSGVDMTVDRVGITVKQMNDLLRQDVLVGIPAENAAREPQDGDTINNAQIGYIHEFGVPSKNIPARPHLVPGIRAYAARAVIRLKAAAQAALDPNDPQAKRKVDDQLNAIGLEAVSSVRSTITNGLSPPLSPKTIYARQHRKTKPVRMGTQPLIDFGDYLRHISYVIRKSAKK